MTELDQKITFHAIMVISRIKKDQSLGTHNPFNAIVAETAALASSATGLKQLIGFMKNFCKSIGWETEDEKGIHMATKNLTVSKNEAKNILRILEIKKEKDPEGEVISFVKDYKEKEIPELIKAAIKRASEKAGNSTVMPFHVLEFYNYNQTQLRKSFPLNSVEISIEEPERDDVQIQTSYYGKPLVVVYTSLPFVKLTYRPL